MKVIDNIIESKAFANVVANPVQCVVAFNNKEKMSHSTTILAKIG